MKPGANGRTGKIIRLGLSLLVLAGAVWVALERQTIIDWWRLRSYTPPARIVQVAEATTMVGLGRDMFYVSDPRIEERDVFNTHCGDKGEATSVLGCYAMQQIYIFNVTDPRLPNVVEVTAAHEMLHAAYDRLSNAERDHVDGLLIAEEKKRNGDQALQSIIAVYAKTEPGEKLNELHSIFGTEFTDLSPELETYYKQYFGDRTKVATMAQAYKAVFAESKARVVEYNKQLASLKQQIDANTAQLEQRIAAINAESDELDALRRTNPTAYNQRVPAYNAKVNTYNALARATQQLVSEYNAIVVKINSEAAKQTDLNNSLDSKYHPVSEQ